MKNPNGFGSVYKLHGNRRKPFAACVTVGRDGKKCLRKYIGYYETQREALSALASYNDSPFDVSARDITMSELWERWKDYRQGRGKTVPSNYENAFRHCAAMHEKRFVAYKKLKFWHKKRSGDFSPPCLLLPVASKLHALEVFTTRGKTAVMRPTNTE